MIIFVIAIFLISVESAVFPLPAVVMSNPSQHHRILIVDDTPSIHDAIRQCLLPTPKDELASDEEELFGPSQVPKSRDVDVKLKIDSAYQGQEALAMVEMAMRIGKPYSMAFVDVRMPTGWDGIETIEHLWAVDPKLEAVVCTAFSDYTWQELVQRLHHSDRFIILKKPFDGIEVRQLAMSLTAKVELRLAHEKQIEMLEEAVNTAIRASAAKSEFLANMSHEIRTPLNGVVGMLELLSDKPLGAEESRFVRGAQASVNCLLSLVNDILDFSKIEAGKVELDPAEFNLPRLLEDVGEILGHKAEQKGVEICCDLPEDLPIMAIADGDRIRQVLLNLAGNAVKFTEKGQIVIRARTIRMESSEALIRFEVQDSGIGIAEDRRDRLFQVFSQVDASTTRRYGGTGLGLALSKRLVELLGGEIGFESKLGVGSTFYFTVPVKPVSIGAGTQVLPDGFKQLRVLLVDDNETNLEILKCVLAKWGISCGAVTYAPQALAELRLAQRSGTPYGLVITDMQMPDMDGLAFVRALKTFSDFRNLPVIMLSSVGQTVMKDQLIASGLSACLSKPVRQSRLFSVIIDALAERPEALPVPEGSQPNVVNFNHCFKILVAEDNDMNQQVISAYLKKLGIDCTMVDCGTKAVELARTRGFDLVLMDWQMPEMNGVEAVRQIRICEQFVGGLARGEKRLPVIAVTAHAMAEDRDKCMEAGMDGYLIKPLNARALTNLLQEHLTQPAQRGAMVLGAR